MKKKLLLCLSLLLIAAMAITGTMAYFTDTDSDANVMTLGNVKIEQIEQERDADGNLVDFKQAKPAFPAVGEVAWNDAKTEINGGKFNMFGDKLKNVVDKIVSVKNTGKSDAYFRTIIAIEDPFTVEKVAINVGADAYIGSPWYSVEIDGVVYSVKAYTYKVALEPGETSLPSLLQAYLKSDTTNEDAALLGDTWDILALSQAVQTAGFDDAETALNTGFGEVNAENIAEWFGGIKIPEVVDKDSIKDALEEGKDVVFGDDIEMPAAGSNGYGATAIKVYKGQTIDGADNTFKALQATGTWDSGIAAYGGTIKNLTVGKGFRGIFISHITGDNGEKCGLVTLENVVIDGSTYTISCDQGTNNGLKAVNSTFNGWTSYAATLGDVEFIDCNFGEGNGYAFCRPYAPTTFVGCDFEAGYEIDARAAVTFENCTIDGVALTADNLATLVTGNIANASVK